jgi:hypothetical protein
MVLFSWWSAFGEDHKKIMSLKDRDRWVLGMITRPWYTSLNPATMYGASAQSSKASKFPKASKSHSTTKNHPAFSSHNLGNSKIASISAAFHLGTCRFLALSRPIHPWGEIIIQRWQSFWLFHSTLHITTHYPEVPPKACTNPMST